MIAAATAGCIKVCDPCSLHPPPARVSSVTCEGNGPRNTLRVTRHAGRSLFQTGACKNWSSGVPAPTAASSATAWRVGPSLVRTVAESTAVKSVAQVAASEKMRLAVQSRQNTWEPKCLEDFDRLYEKTEIIGGGIFGQVFLCKNISSGKEYAVIKRNHLWEEKYIKDELKAMARLRETHPNVLQVVDFFGPRKADLCVVELLKGEPLRCRIKEGGVLSSEEGIKKIMKQILLGLEFMHDRGVAHCDIKPENIMFERENDVENLKVKIIDLHMSLALDGVPASGYRGTQCYMAPECLGATPSFDVLRDVWSCGIMLYEMLLGVHYPQLDRVAPKTGVWQILQVLRAPDDDPEMRTKEDGCWFRLNPSSKDLMRKMLEVDPQKRWTARQCLDHPWFEEGKV